MPSTAGIGRLAQTGALRRLYERYGDLDRRAGGTRRARSTPRPAASADGKTRGWALIARYGVDAPAGGRRDDRALARLDAAGDRARAAGRARPALRADGRCGRSSTGYVELLRGTPLMLQLYVLFFLLPELGIELPAMLAGVIGLAINYSAYEAEIYRAGLRRSRRADGGGARAGDDPADGPAAGHRAAGGADRDPAGDERLHRPVQGHVGLLGDLAGRADQAVLDPGQQHRRRRRVRGADRRALPG